MRHAHHQGICYGRPCLSRSELLLHDCPDLPCRLDAAGTTGAASSDDTRGDRARGCNPGPSMAALTVRCLLVHDVMAGFDRFDHVFRAGGKTMETSV